MKTALVIILIVAIGGAAYVGIRANGPEKPGTRFITVPVERGVLRAEVNCTGTLSPLVVVQVGSQVSGTIKDVYVDFESRVKRGELIALIDPALFQAKVAQAQADVEAARAALEKARVTLEDELRDLKRQEQLLEKGSISQSDFDAAKTQADAARAQVDVEKSRVAQAQARLKEAELQLQYTRILAPVNGVVVSRSIDPGQTVAANFQAPVLFKIAEDLRRMQVDTNVDEADIGRVEVGRKALFSVPAFPERVFEAVVKQIRNEPIIEQNVVTYNVVLGVDNSDLKLRPGMTAHVRILEDEVKDALMVFAQALRFTPPVEGRAAPPPVEKAGRAPNERVVWKLLPNGKVRPTPVRTGVRSSRFVQIFSETLKAGDEVAVGIKTQRSGAPRMRGLRFKF